MDVRSVVRVPAHARLPVGYRIEPVFLPREAESVKADRVEVELQRWLAEFCGNAHRRYVLGAFLDTLGNLQERTHQDEVRPNRCSSFRKHTLFLVSAKISSASA